VAYRTQLPERFSAVHNVFHVTQLKKGMPVPDNKVITEANAWIEPDFSLIEHPLRVLDQKERGTRRQTVRMYKIQWSHHTEEEATWEMEDYLNTKYPGFLQSRNRDFSSPSYCSQVESRDEILFKGVGCDAPGFQLTLTVGQPGCQWSNHGQPGTSPRKTHQPTLLNPFD
jgi:hypothetical protein